MDHIIQGLIMGFAYVAPIGVQNLFVMNAALTLERRRALLTAVIVIFFDVTLALACFWWVGAVMQRYLWLQRLILLSGALVMLYIGYGLLRSGPATVRHAQAPLSVRKICSFACVVTWFNPQAVIDGTMMLGAFHAMLAGEGATGFISGVALASTLWFLSLTLALSLFRTVFGPRAMRIINVLSGVVILGYGGRLLMAGLEMFQPLFEL